MSCFKMAYNGTRVGEVVNHGVKVGHVYLRNNKKEEISKIRETLRNWRHKIEVKKLEAEFGKNWNQILFKYE